MTGLLQSGQTGHLDKSIGMGPPPVHDSGHRTGVKVHFRFILIWYNGFMYGFVTDSPLFDNPGGFYRALTNEEDIRLRASAQQAMQAGRPMTVAEMYGKPQQLFTTLRGAENLGQYPTQFYTGDDIEAGIEAGVEMGVKTMGMALLLIAGLGAGVIGLVVGAIAGAPGKGFLIGAFGVPIFIKVIW